MLNINLYTTIIYIIAAFFIMFLLFSAYVRIKYQFWALQPVFHYYDFYYWFVDVGIIDKEPPKKNKYYQPKIKTIYFEDLSKQQLTNILTLIQTHYLQNGDNTFLPTDEYFVPYFIGHNKQCPISLYYEPKLIQDASSNIVDVPENIISVLTSRPLHVKITNRIEMMVYYVDYLCVDKMYRKKGIAPQMIQTHKYNQDNLLLNNGSSSVCLFKREDELTGIIPLCVYTTFGFQITKWRKPQDLTSDLTVLRCDSQNMYYLMDFLKINNNLFKVYIIPEVSNLLELVKTNNVFIYMIMSDKKIQCVYFFRKTRVYIKKEEEILCCFASINVSATNKVFVHGYKVAFWKIKEKYAEFNYAVVENISHNNKIIDELIIKTHPLKSPTAYFFYNFAYHTFEPNDILIIH